MYCKNTNTKKSRCLIALISVLVLASIINIIGIGGVSQVSALTQQQCYDKYNGAALTTLPARGIFEQTFLDSCLASGAGGTSGDCTAAGTTISCKNPVQEAASAAAAKAVIEPLIKAVCGTAPPITNQTGAYLACSNKVVTDYNACSTTGGGVTSNALDTPQNTAQCFVAKGNKISVAVAAAAIAQGRADGASITTEASLAQAKKDCEASGNVFVNNKCVPKPKEAGSKAPTCQGGAMGWVLCPMIEGMREVSKTASGFLSGLLATSPLYTTGDSSSIYIAWNNIRNIANVIFVLAFIIIIFSQATSAGITNYGIKRLLPKIIIAAILVNISYFLCQVAVDISNIAGSSIASLFGQTVQGIGDAASSSLNTLTDPGTATAPGKLMSIGIVLLALSFGMPVIILILVTFAVLAVRSALIILLTIVSPLAFVLWLLPNTDKYFKKWLSLFGSMLALYPMVMAVFAAATIASTIVENQKPPSMVNLLLALVIQALPLLAIPAIFRASSGALGKIHNAVASAGTKGAGKAKSKYSDSSLGKYREQKKGILKGQELMGNYTGRNPLRKARSRVTRTVYDNGAFNTVSGGYGQSARDNATIKRNEGSERAATFASQNPALAHAMLNYARSGDVDAAADAAGLDANATMILRQQVSQGVVTKGAGAARIGVAALAQGGKLKVEDIREAEAIIGASNSLNPKEKAEALGGMASEILTGSSKSGMVQHGNWGYNKTTGVLEQGKLGTKRTDPTTGISRPATTLEAIGDDLKKKNFTELHYNALRQGTGGREAIDNLMDTDTQYRAQAVTSLADNRVNSRIKDEIRASLHHMGYDDTGTKSAAARVLRTGDSAYYEPTTKHSAKS